MNRSFQRSAPPGAAKKFVSLLLCACAAAALLAGCGGQSKPEQSQPPTPPTSADALTPSTPEPAPTEPPSQSQTATLYIGTKAAGFAEYPLDIWYYMEGEQPLELPDIGRSWPLDQPYQWAAG